MENGKWKILPGNLLYNDFSLKSINERNSNGVQNGKYVRISINFLSTSVGCRRQFLFLFLCFFCFLWNARRCHLSFGRTQQKTTWPETLLASEPCLFTLPTRTKNKNNLFHFFVLFFIWLFIIGVAFTWTSLNGPPCGILDMQHLSAESQAYGSGRAAGRMAERMNSRRLSRVRKDQPKHFNMHTFHTVSWLLILCMLFFYRSPGTVAHKKRTKKCTHGLLGGVVLLGGMQMSYACCMCYVLRICMLIRQSRKHRKLFICLFWKRSTTSSCSLVFVVHVVAEEEILNYLTSPWQSNLLNGNWNANRNQITNHNWRHV